MDKLLIEKYWRTVAGTRKARRISSSVITKTEEKWQRFDEDVVEEALRIHISRCGDMKENYTLGIMRNLQRRKEAGKPVRQENRFNRMERQDYDISAMEAELVENY